MVPWAAFALSLFCLCASVACLVLMLRATPARLLQRMEEVESWTAKNGRSQEALSAAWTTRQAEFEALEEVIVDHLESLDKKRRRIARDVSRQEGPEPGEGQPVEEPLEAFERRQLARYR